jgi:RNA polymerase sigma-70 factor (ECF subfamily)
VNIVIVDDAGVADAGAQPVTFGPADFDGFFAQYYRPTVRILSSGGEHAEDAVQEAFTQAYLRWRTICTYDRPDAWVLRVAVNRMLNERRRLLRRDRNAHRMAEREATEMENPTNDLAEIIRVLPVRQRMALTLRYLADLDISEVADMMRISDGAVRYHLHEARAALRDRLTTNDEKEEER